MQVAKGSVPLSALHVLVRGHGSQTMTISDMQQSGNFTVLLCSLPITTIVNPAGAVQASSNKRELIDVGSYVQFSAHPEEVGHINH